MKNLTIGAMALMFAGLAAAQGPEAYVGGGVPISKGFNFGDTGWHAHSSAHVGLAIPDGPVAFAVEYQHVWGIHPPSAQGKADVALAGVTFTNSRFEPGFKIGAARISPSKTGSGPWEARAAWEVGATLFKYGWGEKNYWIESVSGSPEKHTVNRYTARFRVKATKVQGWPVVLTPGLEFGFRL